jgi:hypothetical protein
MVTSTTAALRVEHVCKAYANHVAVRDVSLAVPTGTVFGLLGPNGAGKTTTIRMILNLMLPDAGRIEVLGRPNRDPALTDRLGYLPEERGLYRKMQVRRVLRFLGRLKGLDTREADRRLDRWLERLGLRTAQQTVDDERFAREYGPWRPVVAQVADKFLACGVLEHGFARIRCDDCAHESLLAFSCKCRYFCPSCHAKRLALWTQWLDTTLLAPVPHRQVVLTIPKRLRAYCLYRRRLLGEIARAAARTVTAAIRTLTGERDLAVGIVACLQTHGSRANWHPHLHLLVTDGGFRPDSTFEQPRLCRRLG